MGVLTRDRGGGVLSESFLHGGAKFSVWGRGAKFSMGVLNDHFQRLTSSKSILLTLHGGAKHPLVPDKLHPCS